jgi:DNA-directed RNA polymerase subunit RPC12/RpoP
MEERRKKIYWCLNCERTFYLDSLGWKSKCPYEDCGVWRWDLWEWKEIRKLIPDYPEVPIEGKKYSLYGKLEKNHGLDGKEAGRV